MMTSEKLAAALEVMDGLEKAGLISVINWLYTVDDELPDDDVTVYVAIEGEDEPIAAFHQCEDWFHFARLDRLTGVYAWAHIPALPPLPKPLRDEEGQR